MLFSYFAPSLGKRTSALLLFSRSFSDAYSKVVAEPMVCQTDGVVEKVKWFGDKECRPRDICLYADLRLTKQRGTLRYKD